MVTVLLIIANVFFSYKGLTAQAFFDKYDFQIEKVTLYKDYKRLITSGFLHVSWLHLGLNMLALFFFSGTIISSLGELNFLIIYFGSMIGANLLSLLIHRQHGDYSSVGASGAICGVVFATIALYPHMRIGLILLPAIPAWIYGVLYMAFAIYGVKSQKNNVGHEVHLGGSLVGMLLASLIEPAAFVENYIIILLITVPALVFIYLIITRPHLLLIDNLYFKKHSTKLTADQRYNIERKNKQEEIDRLLDKIGKKGINSLTAKERDFLNRHSQDVW